MANDEKEKDNDLGHIYSSINSSIIVLMICSCYLSFVVGRLLNLNNLNVICQTNIKDNTGYTSHVIGRSR